MILRQIGSEALIKLDARHIYGAFAQAQRERKPVRIVNAVETHGGGWYRVRFEGQDVPVSGSELEDVNGGA